MQNLTLVPISHENVNELQQINTALFPIVYNDKFYLQANPSDPFWRLVYWNENLVGAFCCKQVEQKLYIMTFGVLAKYRRNGIASFMLDYLIDQAKNEELSQIYLHVQVSNNAALKFYQKHLFRITNTVQEYYKKIEPRAAHILIRDI